MSTVALHLDCLGDHSEIVDFTVIRLWTNRYGSVHKLNFYAVMAQFARHWLENSVILHIFHLHFSRLRTFITCSYARRTQSPLVTLLRAYLHSRQRENILSIEICKSLAFMRSQISETLSATIAFERGWWSLERHSLKRLLLALTFSCPDSGLFIG